MNKNLITLLCIAGAFFSCNPEDKEKALQEDVIEIHDEAMPLMDELMRQKRRIQFRIDSLRISGEANEEQIEELQKNIRELRRADSAMMNWMRQFNALPADTVTHEDRIKYLKKEKSRIKKVHEMMVNAIEKAETVRQ
jgi:hypothetical protein